MASRWFHLRLIQSDIKYDYRTRGRMHLSLILTGKKYFLAQNRLEHKLVFESVKTRASSSPQNVNSFPDKNPLIPGAQIYELAPFPSLLATASFQMHRKKIIHC